MIVQRENFSWLRLSMPAGGGSPLQITVRAQMESRRCYRLAQGGIKTELQFLGAGG